MPLPRRVAKPRLQEEVWAGAVPLVGAAERPRQLRARPSGLKGRYRDRYATGRRPALDPEASTAPDHATVTGRRTALPAQRGADANQHDQNPTTKSLQF